VPFVSDLIACPLQTKSDQITDKSFTSLTEADTFVQGTESPATSNTVPKKFYAVANGRVPGVYTYWPTAQQQIVGWQKPKHKSFATRAEAEAFVAEGPGSREVTGVFLAPTSPPPIKVHEGALAITPEATPAAKKTKANTKAKQVAQMMTGPGFDPLPTDAEDGFDNRILMDPDSGDLRYKTDQERNAMKVVPKTEHFNEQLHIWTDGACMFNGQQGASIGGVGVYFGPQDPRSVLLLHTSTLDIESNSQYRNVAEPLLGKQTNNRAELTAIKRALSIAPMNRNVCIHSDSKYAIDCVTKWFGAWIKKDWKTSSGKDVENKELIQEILAILNDRHVCRSKTHFDWIKGHAGHPENEEADRLAVAGAQENRDKGIIHPAALVDENGKGVVYGEDSRRLVDKKVKPARPAEQRSDGDVQMS
jgi:ribonuclease HI